MAEASVDEDGYWMSEALLLANKALEDGEIPVGCLFVSEGAVVARGSNATNATKNATRHAEMVCIDEVHSRGIPFSSVTVYVTVEPCGMCAAALHDLCVKRIVFGCPNDRFGGCGSVVDVARYSLDPVPVVGGVLGDSAMSLLKKFYKGTNPNAPLSKVKTRKKTHE